MRAWLETRLDGISEAVLAAFMVLGVQSFPWESAAALLLLGLASALAVAQKKLPRVKPRDQVHKFPAMCATSG